MKHSFKCNIISFIPFTIIDNSINLYHRISRWMQHCHIAEHLYSGMMWGFEVKD